jgi:small conductance mechanosensitive channel
MDPNLAALDQIRITAIDLGMKFGPKLLVAIIIMVAGYFAARWAAAAVGRPLVRFGFEPPVRQLVLNITRGLVLILFAIMALQNLGVELLPLIAGLGVAGAGIALAMQGVLSNLVAGLVIIVTRPFRVGDYISIVKEEGVVTDIRLANTTLTHADLSRVVIPNRRIVGEILHNYGQIRQLQVEVRVGYDADLAKAFAALEEVLGADSRVLKDPAPVLKVSALKESGVTVGAYPWVRVADYGAAAGDLNRAVVETFRARGVVIPLPRSEVRMLAQAA